MPLALEAVVGVLPVCPRDWLNSVVASAGAGMFGMPNARGQRAATGRRGVRRAGSRDERLRHDDQRRGAAFDVLVAAQADLDVVALGEPRDRVQAHSAGDGDVDVRRVGQPFVGVDDLLVAHAHAAVLDLDRQLALAGLRRANGDLGDRVGNAVALSSGSKKMRDLLNAEDWDGLVALGKEQEREGAHILDVNVDFVGRDGEADMHELASRLVDERQDPSDVRLDRVGEDGSRTSARRRQEHSQLDKL